MIELFLAPIPLCPPDLPHCDLNEGVGDISLVWYWVALVVLIGAALFWYRRQPRE
jgi:hypothetical protein